MQRDNEMAVPVHPGAMGGFKTESVVRSSAGWEKGNQVSSFPSSHENT